jgi:hypothetical protein
VHDLLFLQSFILGVEKVGSCVIRYNLDEYMHSVCFCFGWCFFFGHCLALYVCCVLEGENSKDFIHLVCCGFCGGTNCYMSQ